MSVFDSELTVETAVVQGWWLVTEAGAGGGGDVVAGPFADRAEAEWAALASGLDTSDGARMMHAARRGDGELVRRPSPEEWAWLDRLGEQLDRLGEDWDQVVSDTDALTTLVAEVAAALLDAGLSVYDDGAADPGTGSQGSAAGGGVCLTPAPGQRGIIVSWRAHDRISIDLARGADADAVVRQAMDHALAGILRSFGFAVEAFGAGSAHLVRVADS